MRKRAIQIILVVLVTWVFPKGYAQKYDVVAEIDSVQMWIGQQAELRFNYSQEADEFVQAPIFSEKITDEIEIVERLEPDTILSPDGYLTVSQKYIITSFVDSLLLIPDFPFVYEEDTIYSNELSLKVIQPFEIDLENIQVADIKEVFKPKFSLWCFIKKSIPYLLALLLLAVLAYLVYYLIKNKKQKEDPELYIPPIPPHELALSSLEKIREEKLWQRGLHKEYHSELTDVLRVYIEGVFDIGAMEMTSDEILSSMRDMKTDNKQVYSYLQQILHLADLVKFAKWNVGQDEHESSLKNAFSFVNETYVIEEEEEVEEDDIS